MLTSCPECGRETIENAAFCPGCGAALTKTFGDASAHETTTAPPPSSAAGGDGARAEWQARLGPGTVVNGRYRVVSQIGRGGMGEVFRADDLKLGAPVALKFLSGERTDDAARRDLFLNEVRVARQITHPAVCRVHDIDEWDGRPFLSMELVDGEDLASLLRRIGRLPSDKALDIARELCAGLGAAHKLGVLHRDLKPANIMLDGRGRVRITDFGLSAFAATLSRKEARSGTPAYMAPEQLAGESVSTRSDLYALGLVLYELFTGRRAFEARTGEELLERQKSQPPTAPSTISAVDPNVERVVLQCLEPRPEDRPRSTLAVAAALPGGDPLAAAIAAGETPSPELVAAQEDSGQLSPARAWAWLGAVVAFGAAYLFLSEAGKVFPHQLVPFETPPLVLEARAREILAELGHELPAADTKSGFEQDFAYFGHVAKENPEPGRWDHLQTGRPPVVRFWYRQSPVRLVATTRLGRVTRADPPHALPGMAEVQVDTLGRLVGLSVRPSSTSAPPGAGLGEMDWGPLFDLAGLSLGTFSPVQPTRVPEQFADTRAEWTGHFEELPDVPIRIEAAAFEGHPVAFRIVGDWSESTADPTQEPLSTAAFVLFALTWLAFGFSCVLARRNWQLGRGDRRGAGRLSLFTFLVLAVAFVGEADHVADPRTETGLLVFMLLGFPAINALMVWTFYLAFEPYARSRWPRWMISWARLLAGAWRDPRVGRDVLAGVALALLYATIDRGTALPLFLGLPEAIPTPGGIVVPDSAAGHLVGFAAVVVSQGFLGTIITLMLLVPLRTVVRRDWAAVGLLILIYGLLFGGLNVAFGLPAWIALPLFTLRAALPAVVLFRLGVLASLITAGLGHTLHQFPATTDPGSLQAPHTAVVMLSVLALAVWGFKVSLGRQRAFGALLPD